MQLHNFILLLTYMDLHSVADGMNLFIQPMLQSLPIFMRILPIHIDHNHGIPIHRQSSRSIGVFECLEKTTN